MTCGQSQCGCGCSTLQGWASQSLLGSQGMSGLSGMGDVSYGGDHFKAGVQIPYGMGGGNYQAIADAMNGSGEFYGVTSYQTAGTINPWITIEGFINNGYYSTPYELESKILDYVRGVTQSVDAGSWQWIDLAGHPDPNSGDTSHLNTQPTTPAPVGTPPASGATLAQLQAYCAAQGLVYDVASTKPGGCECGFIDGLLVSVGLKSSCQASAFGAGTAGVAGGLGIAAIALVAFLVISKR